MSNTSSFVETTLSHMAELALGLCRLTDLAQSIWIGIGGKKPARRNMIGSLLLPGAPAQVSPRPPTRRRRPARRILAAPLLVTACSAAQAQDVLGSFFPAWMLCAAIGIVASVACRIVLGAAGIEPYVPAAPLTYIAVAVAMTLLVWLLWFGH